ncbi:hypothetical protein JL720_3197 [Aureococcus anophagefferens]|nr:hypothetical protein JL720_3197 [Aureococcus anophagefferens]
MPSPVAVSVHVEAPGSWSPRAAAAWHLAHLWRQLQIVVAFDDSDEFEAEDFQSSDAAWRAAGRCVVRSGEDTANAEKTVADAVRAAESRLARRAFAQFGALRPGAAGPASPGAPSSAAPPRVCSPCASRATIGPGASSWRRTATALAPAACGLLGAAGVAADCRRSGCRLHVLDYGGGLSAGAGEANRNSREPSPDGVDDPVVQALGAGDDDDDDADDSCFGLAPDWASVALVCERAGGSLLGFDARGDLAAFSGARRERRRVVERLLAKESTSPPAQTPRHRKKAPTKDALERLALAGRRSAAPRRRRAFELSLAGGGDDAAARSRRVADAFGRLVPRREAGDVATRGDAATLASFAPTSRTLDLPTLGPLVVAPPPASPEASDGDAGVEDEAAAKSAILRRVAAAGVRARVVQALDDCCGACALDGTEDDGLAWCAVEDGVAMVARCRRRKGEELTFAEVDARAARPLRRGGRDRPRTSPGLRAHRPGGGGRARGRVQQPLLGLLRERRTWRRREVRDALDWCDWTGGRRANAALAGERALARADALAAAAAGCWDRAGFLRLGALTGGDGDSYAFVGPRRGEDPLSEGEDGRTTPQVGDEPYTPPPSVGRAAGAAPGFADAALDDLGCRLDAAVAALSLACKLARPREPSRRPRWASRRRCGASARRGKAPTRRRRRAARGEGVECKIDIVAYGGDDAGVAGKRMPPNLETFFAAALCERWAADDAKPAPSRGATNEAFARVERSLKRIAFRRAGDAYVAVDARDEKRPPEGYFASVRVDECQIHYSARQADVVAVPQRRYGRAAYARGGAGTYAMGPDDAGAGRRRAAALARRPARRCRRRRATRRRARASCRRAGPGDAGTQARGDALRRRRGPDDDDQRRALRGKTADDEAKDREAVARALRCALSRASRVASQLRLLGAVVATLAHEPRARWRRRRRWTPTLKCALDADDCARRAFTADFFAGDPEARAPLDVDGDDLALLLAERPTRRRWPTRARRR